MFYNKGFCRDHKTVKKNIRHNLEYCSDSFLREKLEKSIHKLNTNTLYLMGTTAAAFGSIISILISADWAAIIAIPPTAVSIVECFSSYDKRECAKIRIDVIKNILKNREKKGVLYLNNFSNIKIQTTIDIDNYTENDSFLHSLV